MYSSDFKRLFDEFALAAFRPGIIGEAELHAVPNGGMAVEKEKIDFIRVGIGQDHIAEHLKGLRGNLTRIRHESQRAFQAVLIGLIFLIPASGADTRAPQGKEA